MIKILELFGGIGAPRKALINLGVEHKSIDYVEWNEKAVRSYNAMFDNRYKPESVVGYNLKPDILVHGSPCQDFSIAGKQYGGNVEDGTRSSLMFETIKIIENLGAWRPRIILWENVTNVLNKKHNGAFNRYLNDMQKLGYSSNFEILDATDFGMPQKRKRVFVVSKLDGIFFNFQLLEKKPLKSIWNFIEEEANERYTVTAKSMLRYIKGSPSFVPATETKFKGRIEVINDRVNTITTAQDRNPNSGVIDLKNGKYRILTEKECWRLMGFDDKDFLNAEKEHPRRNNFLNTTLYHQAGNSIVVNVLEELFDKLI